MAGDPLDCRRFDVSSYQASAALGAGRFAQPLSIVSGALPLFRLDEKAMNDQVRSRQAVISSVQLEPSLALRDIMESRCQGPL